MLLIMVNYSKSFKLNKYVYCKNKKFARFSKGKLTP